MSEWNDAVLNSKQTRVDSSARDVYSDVFPSATVTPQKTFLAHRVLLPPYFRTNFPERDPMFYNLDI